MCIVTILVMVPKELLRLPMWAGRSLSTRLFRRLKACNIDFNSVTSLWRCSSTKVVLTAAIAGDGVATSMLLSASWAKLLRLPVSGVEAKTIRTFGGKCCRKSSCRKALSVSWALFPNSCCTLLKNCDGFLSSSSSAWNSCCKYFCSEEAVR